jgi:hypothetical protein
MVFLELSRLLLHLWGVSLLCLFCFMREYPYILGVPKECRVILVQKCWFFNNGLGFSLSNSWNNYLEEWEFFDFKFGMMLLLWWLNYHVFYVLDDTRACVPMGFKENSFVVIWTWLFVGNVQVELLWYVGTMRVEKGRTSWLQDMEIGVI